MAKYTIGGQAVIEGIMMRSPKIISLAVRKADGSIHVESKSASTIRDKYPILNKPFIRGVIVLWESLCDGMVGLQRSAQMATDGTEEEMTTTESISTVLVAVLVGGGLNVQLMYVKQRLLG